MTRAKVTLPSLLGYLLDLAHKVRLEAARRIVPLQTLAIPVPQLHAVLLLAVLVTEVIGFARIPVGERNGTARCHPEEVSLVRQISARRPEVLVAETCNEPNECVGGWLTRLPLCIYINSIAINYYRNHGRASPGGRSPPATICWPGACRGTGSTGRPYTSSPASGEERRRGRARTRLLWVLNELVRGGVERPIKQR